MGRIARWLGLAGIGWRRVHYRLRSRGNRQTLICVVGVALSVALLLLVASVGVGLTTSAAGGDRADYWIVPDAASSAVTDVEGGRLGDVHTTADGLAERDDVAYASPMLVDFVRLERPDGRSVRVLAIGVVPSADHPRIGPLSSADLTPGDPHYAAGSYDGPWTGEAVLSESAAAELDAEPGSDVPVDDTVRTVTVAGVEPPDAPGFGQLPVAVVHLSELQALTGASDADAANQLVVFAPGATAETERGLADVYPRTSVQTRGGLLSERGMDSRLPAATALAALLVVVVTATLLVSTAFGFELAADSERRQLVSALGVSTRARLGLVGVELLVTSIYGGVLGVLLWLVGLVAVNGLSMARYDVAVAAFDPWFVAYGVATAVLVGLLSLPYLLVVDWRSKRPPSLT